MDMDSEHKLVGHVDGNDEADNLCEIKASSELTQTENMTITATTYYEKDVDIEEILCDTPEPTNHESTTEDSDEDLTDGSHTRETLKILLIDENKRLVKISKMEMEMEMESQLKEKIRTGLRLKCLSNTKSHFDMVETMPIYQKLMEDKSPLAWETSNIPVQISKWEKKYLEQEYEIWIEICKTLENRRKWEEYKIIFENYWEDLEEEDMEIIKVLYKIVS